MPTVEERVDSLESILGQFIVNTDTALRRLENEMRAFREESERDRKALHAEMKVFKDEMKVFKDEMKVFKDEMKVFKDEMKVFKDEMKVFKDEMKVFKDEMVTFRERQEEENRRKNKEWSNLAKKMGTIVEDLIAPALRPVLKKYFQCEVNLEGQRMFRRRNGKDYEIDAIAGCKGMVFMIEVRSTPRSSDVREIKEKSERFFEFFPEFKGKRLIVIFGSITFPDNVIRYASRKGVYVLGWREWEYMDILNFERVK